MRTLKFRFWKDKKLQGILELKQNNILDMGWEWDTVDQFTGLLDKQGVEIYEGDILLYKDGQIREVKINIMFRKSMGNYEGPGGTHFYISLNIGCTGDFECEVIGNIYENPELLKEK